MNNRKMIDPDTVIFVLGKLAEARADRSIVERTIDRAGYASEDAQILLRQRSKELQSLPEVMMSKFDALNQSWEESLTGGADFSDTTRKLLGGI